jgi:hypothetical protein
MIHPFRSVRMRSLVVLSLLLFAGCRGPGRVEFSAGQCVIDGRTATLAEVESRQARTSERIVARQPVMVLVTILVVLLAGASHIEKLVLLFSTRRSGAHGLGERIRVALDRYRDHPLRYFSIVAGTLLLLGVAGGTYVFLDAEKRANERALGLLQFCHVALRNQQADAMLDEQRRNLANIESTAGSIRSLVDRLPPQQQADAKQIVEQLRRTLGDQGKLVNAYAEKTDESARELREHTQLVEHGISSLETGLKILPAAFHDLSQQLEQGEQRRAAAEQQEKAKLDALKASLDALAARPAPQCPACLCEGARSVDGGVRAR